MLKHKKNIFLVILIVGFLLISPNLTAQLGELYSTIGYNFYNNKEIKSFQNGLKNDIDLPIEITDDFPDYYGFKIGYLTPAIVNFKFDVFVSNYTTGGKISYADYSGGLSITQELDAINIGVSMLYHIEKVNNLYLKASLLLSGSNLNVNQEYYVYDYQEMESMDFKSLGLGVEIGIKYDIDLKYIKVLMGADVSLYSPSELWHEEYSLIDSMGKEVHINWSGFRFYTGLSIPIFPWNSN